MFRHRQKKILPFPAELIFGIVTDIEKYPQFLPWCKAARINQHTNNNIIAELIVGKATISQKFTSKVTYNKPNNNNTKFSVITEYIDGPLKFMKSHWYITPKNKNRKQNCQVEFSVEFAFRHKFLHSIFQKLFEEATIRMIEAFTKRAETLHTNKNTGIATA